MSKQYKMRWRESDIKELERVIKNFNAKLYRISKKNPGQMGAMPQRLVKSEVIGKIDTRRDFNILLNSFKRFSKRGAEKVIKTDRGANITEWAVKEYKHKERIANARKKKRKDELDSKQVTSRGKPVGVTRAQMGSIEENSVTPSDRNVMGMSKRDFERAFMAVEKEILDSGRREFLEQAKENYIKAMNNEGFSEELQDLVRSIPLDLFIATLDTDENAAFDFVYSEIERGFKEEVLWEVWESVVYS